MADFFSGTRILVTGASGSVGSALVETLLRRGVREVRCVDINEEQMFLMDMVYADEPKYQSFVCDVRDEHLLPRLMENVDYVIHAAALKHVPSCERTPETAINTNILGVQNVIRSASNAGVKKVLFTSSDKAVNPTNVMGTTKLMGERLITAANLLGGGTAFFSTRFGNVTGSRGSVMPVFRSQIEKGGPLTLTHKDMSRFMMTVEESVNLILESLIVGIGGEIFITKMPVFRIEDLAKCMISELAPTYGHDVSAIKVKEIGVRAGEKLYEELMTQEEQVRAFEMEDLFVVLPAHRNMYESDLYDKYQELPRPDRAYVSNEEETAENTVLMDLVHSSLEIHT